MNDFKIKYLFIVLTLLNLSRIEARTSTFMVTPEVRYAVSGILDVMLRKFDDKDLNQERRSFIKDISKQDLTNKELSDLFSQTRYESSSSCLLCLTVGADKISYNISKNRKDLIVGFNDDKKSFKLSTLSLRDIERFILKKSSKKTSHINFQQFFGIANAYAGTTAGELRQTGKLFMGLGIINGLVVGAFTVAGILSTPLWVITGIPVIMMLPSAYAYYQAGAIEREMKSIKTATICCQAVDKFFGKSTRRKRKDKKALYEELENSCIADVDKLLGILNQSSVTQARRDVQEMIENNLSPSIKKIADHKFIKESVSRAIGHGEDLSTVFNRCSVPEDQLEEIRFNSATMKPSDITKKGHQCRKLFQNGLEEYKTTEDYQIAQLAQQCRLEMSKIKSDSEENSNAIFDNNRKQYVAPLREYRKNAVKKMNSSSSI